MKEITLSRDSLMSLLKHAKAGKSICALVPSERHIASCYGYLITEGWHNGYDCTVEPPLPSTLPSNAFSKLPLLLYKFVFKDAGEIVFVHDVSYMASYEDHIQIHLVSKD